MRLSFDKFDQLRESFKDLRSEKRLHPFTEERLAILLKDIYPGAYSKPEPGEIPGGRSDLAFYFGDGRYVIFEIFATVSQVPQDLRHLEQSNAQVRIAILTDPNLDDGKIFEEYFRKRPRDPFKWIKLSDVLVKENEASVKEQLKRYIDEELKSDLFVSQHRGTRNEELIAKRNALREFIANDFQCVGSAIAWGIKFNIGIVSIDSMKPFLKQLDKAIYEARVMEVMFISDKKVKEIFTQVGRLGRLAWNHRVTKDDFKEFLNYRDELEDFLIHLDEDLS